MWVRLHLLLYPECPQRTTQGRLASRPSTSPLPPPLRRAAAARKKGSVAAFFLPLLPSSSPSPPIFSGGFSDDGAGRRARFRPLESGSALTLPGCSTGAVTHACAAQVRFGRGGVSRPWLLRRPGRLVCQIQAPRGRISPLLHWICDRRGHSCSSCLGSRRAWWSLRRAPLFWPACAWLLGGLWLARLA